MVVAFLLITSIVCGAKMVGKDSVGREDLIFKEGITREKPAHVPPRQEERSMAKDKMAKSQGSTDNDKARVKLVRTRQATNISIKVVTAEMKPNRLAMRLICLTPRDAIMRLRDIERVDLTKFNFFEIGDEFGRIASRATKHSVTLFMRHQKVMKTMR